MTRDNLSRGNLFFSDFFFFRDEKVGPDYLTIHSATQRDEKIENPFPFPENPFPFPVHHSVVISIIAMFIASVVCPTHSDLGLLEDSVTVSEP